MGRSTARVMSSAFLNAPKPSAVVAERAAHHRAVDEAGAQIFRQVGRHALEYCVGRGALLRRRVRAGARGKDVGGDARTRAPPGSWHRPSAVRVWRFWLDDRITRLESLRCSLRSSLGPRTEHAREPGEADRTPTRAASRKVLERSPHEPVHDQDATKA